MSKRADFATIIHAQTVRTHLPAEYVFFAQVDTAWCENLADKWKSTELAPYSFMLCSYVVIREFRQHLASACLLMAISTSTEGNQSYVIRRALFRTASNLCRHEPLDDVTSSDMSCWHELSHAAAGLSPRFRKTKCES